MNTESPQNPPGDDQPVQQALSAAAPSVVYQIKRKHLFWVGGLLAVGALVIWLLSGKGFGRNSPPDRKGELTRELAMLLLKEYFSSTRYGIFELQFTDIGIESATREGLIEPVPGEFHKTWRFTDSTFGRVAPHFKKNEIVIVFGRPPARVRLSQGIREEASTVNGIASPGAGGFTEVELQTFFVLPPELQFLAQYIHLGRSTKAWFRKFDDGWRVEKVHYDD